MWWSLQLVGVALAAAAAEHSVPSASRITHTYIIHMIIMQLTHIMQIMVFVRYKKGQTVNVKSSDSRFSHLSNLELLLSWIFVLLLRIISLQFVLGKMLHLQSTN